MLKKVVETYMHAQSVEIKYFDKIEELKSLNDDYSCVLVQYPDFYGGEYATVTCDYTCEATGDGLYKFTGKFHMLADIALDEMFAKHMIIPIA